YRNQPHGGASAFTGVCPQGYLLAAGDLLLVPSGRTTPAAFDRTTGKLVYYQPYLYLVPYGSEGWGNRGNGGWWATVAGESFLCSMQEPGAPELEAHVGEAEPREGDGIVVYSLATGLRELSLPDRHRALAAGDVLYAAGKAGVQAIDLKAWRETKKLDGCVKWTAEHPRAYCLAMAGSALLAGSRGALTALDAATGKRVWSAKTDGQVRGIAVADGRLVAATSTGGVACYESREISMPPVAVREVPAYAVSAPGQHVDTAAKIVKETGVSQGYALVVGEPDGRLAIALASRTDLHVVAVLPPEADVDAERQRLLPSPLYGSRVAVQKLDGSGRLPYAPYFADLAVVTGDAGCLPGEELYRVLRPCGGVMCFPGMSREDVEHLSADMSAPRAHVRSSDNLRMLIRGRLAGAGEWRSQRADDGNTGIGKESLVRPPFDILWFGGPGPDRMMSRHWGASAPLSVNGRVFVAGQHHVIAFDAYNGREIWCRELRGVGRINADMAASNFVADDTNIFAAVGPECHRLDQATGKTLAVYRVPEIAGAAKAAAEPASVDIEWPGVWQMFAPVPKNSPPLPEATLRAIPEELSAGGKTFRPRAVRPVKGKVDFSHFFGGYGFKALLPDEKPEDHPRGSGATDTAMEGSLAYLFAEIECPSAGTLTMGAGADWWMRWFLDGKPVFDTWKNGNEAGQYSVTNHVFSAGVTKGKHVLAAIVKAGSRGWCLHSAGGAKYERNLRYVPPERMLPRWGYLSVTGDLVLGSYVPAGAKKPDWESSAIFALNKKDGALRWQYRPRRSVFNMSIASGDGRVFMLDGTAPSLLFETKEKARRELTLLALDLKSGDKLWGQDDVPSSANESLHYTMRFVQYAKRVVALGASAGYDAASGRKLWERKTKTDRLSVIWDDWIIAQPEAFDLKTGDPRMVKDALTGQMRPWKFVRAYGCGPIAGCQNMLFFRSGTAGFYDFATDGTTTFGGIRPGCSITMIPANGLMILPEGSSSCSCAYNYQTSLALVSVGESARRPSGNPWNVFHGERTESSLRRLNLNFGAPGDRRDAAVVAWLAFPRPDVPGASPVPLRIVEGAPEYCCRGTAIAPVSHAPEAHATPAWVYASGLRGPCKMVVDLGRAPVAAPAITEPPKIDGDLDDACWKGDVPFEADAHLLAPSVKLFIRRDAQNLYFAFSREAAVRNGKPVSFAAKHTKKDDKNAAQDDSIVFSISDANRKVSLDFAISCGGGTFAKKNTRDGDAEKDVESNEGEAGAEPAKRDTLWHGEWQSAARKDARAWTAEAAIPLAALQAEGLDVASLAVNCTARNTSGQGAATIALTTASSPHGKDAVVPGAFVRVAQEPAPVPERKYTVRLHFAETGADVQARPAFDVELQGKMVLSGRSLLQETGSPGRAVVKEFPGVSAGKRMTLSLVPGSDDAGPKTKLCLCGVEVIAEDK
ncbi:MAG: PQQ-binding-like beta-propeller repeat protein, partial [Planctomycetota bacterium]|nr:PQQ-binding-like beta-propeller repeat protein [Planctomycetota bacterium]